MRGVPAVVLFIAIVTGVAACSTDAVPGRSPTPVPTAVAPSPGDPTPPGPVDEVRVTLGIYSGRPDPTWTLTGAEAAAVERAIEALAEAAGSPPDGGLGYHGFTVVRGPRTITAYLGFVWSGGGGPQILRRDPGRTVEWLLLELGRTELAAQEIAEVERSPRRHTLMRPDRGRTGGEPGVP